MKLKITAIIALVCFTVSGAFAQIDRSKQPQPGPAPTVNLGQPQTFKMDNGMTVMVVENHKLPRARMSITIDNKPHSVGEKVGLQSLYSSMMGSGTKSMDKDTFNEEIDFYGASVGYGSESAYASSLSKFFPKIVRLMADGLLNPKFTQEEFNDQRDQLIEGLNANMKNAGAIAGNVSRSLAYGPKHPYGEFATPKSVKNVKLTDVKSYYQNFITPKNAYMVVVGDIDYTDVKNMVEKEFGKWSASTPPNANLPKVPKVQYTQIDFIDVPSAVQSELRFQNTIELQMNDDDYFPVIVANQILGGGFGSYLNMALREERGFTYGARSSTGADKYASRFVASTSVRNAVTDSAIVEALDQIKKIKTEKVAQGKISNAKAKFAGNFVLRLENPSTVANYAVNIKVNDLPKDFYETYLKNINAVTADDIMRVAKKYYQLDNMQIVVAGKGADVASKLEDITLKGKKIPVLFYNKEGEKVEKKEFNKAVPKGMEVSDVYEKYLKAIGGKSKVRQVNSIVMKSTASLQGQQMDMTMKRTNSGKMMMDLSMAGTTMMKQVFDGKEGYMVQQGQKRPMPEATTKEMKKNTALFDELSVPEKASLTGIQSVDGKDAYVVNVKDKDTDFYYSVDSGLLLQEITTSTQNGQTNSSKATYSDYQAVSGVQMPYTFTRQFGPQTVEFKVQEYKINSGISDEDFK